MRRSEYKLIIAFKHETFKVQTNDCVQIIFTCMCRKHVNSVQTIFRFVFGVLGVFLSDVGGFLSQEFFINKNSNTHKDIGQIVISK